MTIESYDPAAPETLSRPEKFFAAMRRECPVFHDAQSNSYYLSRHADVREAARRPNTFSSHRPIFGTGDPELETIAAEGFREVQTLTPNDPPIHTRYRKLVNRAFAPKKVAALEPAITTIVHDLVGGLVEAGRDGAPVDFVAHFAALVPGYVIADALGVPRSDQKQFMSWTDDIMATIQAVEVLSRERQIECKRSYVDFQHYFAEIIEQRRQQPGEDLISLLVTSRVDGERPLDVEEILDVIRIFLVAGNETTASWIAGTLLLLLDHPEVLAEVRADRELLPQMLEESLRLVSPARWAMRTVEGDECPVVDGVELPAGSRARLLWMSANHDEQTFPEPDRFDIRRDASQHVAFGYGVHLCLGAGLARAEARIAFGVLLDRIADVGLAIGREDVRYLPMAGVSRLAELPVRITATG